MCGINLCPVLKFELNKNESLYMYTIADTNLRSLCNSNINFLSFLFLKNLFKLICSRSVAHFINMNLLRERKPRATRTLKRFIFDFSLYTYCTYYRYCIYLLPYIHTHNTFIYQNNHIHECLHTVFVSIVPIYQPIYTYTYTVTIILIFIPTYQSS